ncbi:substrate-binding domain-containing protein [Paenibacillus aceris]|uniref:DNA-binding LacI/PurR family transcriptional regulator n=1 Tax=Paenibacillus aceris TaxID=869555 RepID=A0ABS4I1T6_9BACL|nr:GntR family transcriptional regulator [Paenibacillus aceris]MBP1964873.1 DNA-binding LacI/PurR family transcriptional regulator [Paenibacillus aceris]NHW38117.1 GntR family transcriptional regulator [Paenibacillus aceris]
MQKKSQNMYLQIATEVEGIIRRRKIKAHDPIPSEGELAKIYNVSRMTAKMALDHLANQGIVYRMPRRGTFLSDVTKNQLTSSRMRSKSIGMVVSNVDSYTSQIIFSIESEAREHDFNLVIKISRGLEDEDSCLRQLVDEQMKGIILFPRARDYCSEQVLKLKAEKYPTVIIDRYFQDALMDCIYYDYYQGTYQMVQHLINKGHREIGLITNMITPISSSEEQHQGYFKSLADNGIPVKSQYIHIIKKIKDCNNFSDDDPDLDQFVRENLAITAIMCGNDYLAASVLYSALRQNIDVPDQLSIVGFADIQLAMLLPVALTTVRQPTDELGKEAIKLLIKRMSPSDDKQNIVKINTQIIERNSVFVWGSERVR